MYQEPIEHFSFLVLHKLSKKDYSRYGDMLERLYVYQSQEMHMSVYNRNLLYGGLYSVLWTFKIGDRISKAITEEYGKRADYIRLMNEKNRKKLCDEVNARKKQAC